MGKYDKIDVNKIKVRKKWPRNPATQVEKPHTDYNRARAKREWQDELEDLEAENADFGEDLF